MEHIEAAKPAEIHVGGQGDPGDPSSLSPRVKYSPKGTLDIVPEKTACDWASN